MGNAAMEVNVEAAHKTKVAGLWFDNTSFWKKKLISNLKLKQSRLSAALFRHSYKELKLRTQTGRRMKN